MLLSEIAQISTMEGRLKAYETYVEQRQDTLSNRLSAQVGFTSKEIDSLVSLVGKKCKKETKDRLFRRLYSWSLLPNRGIFERVYFENQEAHYCAGQDYPTEIVHLRKLLLKG